MTAAMPRSTRPGARHRAAPRHRARLAVLAWLGTVLAGVAVIAPAVAAAPSRTPSPAIQPRRVVVVSIPTLTWRQVQEQRPEAVLALFRTGAAASLSVRAAATTTTLGAAYATIGAGNRAAVTSDAGWAFGPGEVVARERAGDIYRRRTGSAARGAAAVHLAVASIESLNDRLLFGAHPGLLGDAVAAAGGTISVIGNADISDPTDPIGGYHRELTLAGMTSDGRVAAGAVDRALLQQDAAAPFGAWLDPAAVLATFDRQRASAVLLVELSDLWRADEFMRMATPEAGQRAQRAALRRTDELLAAIRDRLDPDRDLLVVVAPVSGRNRTELTMAIMEGPGIRPGLLQSGSTRRPGYVTLPDVAPTVLAWLGLDVPAAMAGAPISSAGGGPNGDDVLADLVEDNRMALFRNAATGPLTVVLVVLQVLGYAAAALVFAWRSRRWYGTVAFVALTTLAVPVVSFLSGVFSYRVLGVGGYIAAVFAVAAALAAAAVRAGSLAYPRDRHRGRLLPPTLLAAATVVTLVTDIVLGGPLQIDTPFGYGGGAIVAGRFAGYGNLAWGTLAAATLVMCCGVWAIACRDATPARQRALLGAFSAVGIVVVLAIGLPQLGLNVGGTLSTVPGLIVLLLLLAGVRVNVRTVAIIAVVSAGVLAAFAGVDLLQPPESRTHLGRLVTLTIDQGTQGLGEVIRRKLAANFRILTSSVWALLIPPAVGFLIFLTVRPTRIMQQLRDSVPGFQAAVVASLVTGVLAGLLNDSGVAIPAMMLVVLLPFVAWLAVLELEPGPTAVPTPPASPPPAGPHQAPG